MAMKKILLLIYCELIFIHCQISIPKQLRECYSNSTLSIHHPLNIRILVDIVRKVERHSYTTMDMRMFSSSLLHRFKFDGIEYHTDVQVTDGILPFSATGTQRIKQTLVEELIPGNADAFPAHILSQTERCMLHRAISNTVMKQNSETAHKSCHQTGETEKITGRNVLTGTWDCPQQQGVILTQYGTVAAGAVIGAVAASLQHQSIAINQLIAASSASFSDPNVTNLPDFDYNEEEVDFVLPKSQMIHGRSMWHQTLMTSSIKLDNIWLATIAGELAEMVIYQGPVVGHDMTLGATGFWNNTMRPSIYYLTESYEYYDATRAELLGGIDGLIITNNLQTWIQDFYSLRLSQILDMYYSNVGMAFNENIKACNRAQGFMHSVSHTILQEQTYAIAQMLAYRKSIAYISPEALKRMVEYAVEKFSSYAKNHLFTELPCPYKKNQPRVEALIVFDGAWSTEYTMDFLAVLIQDLDVSIYGSRMGVIHGTSGEWLLNVTSSPSLAFQTIQNFTDAAWPKGLNYTRVLETTFAHLNKTWKDNHEQQIIGSLGQVVVLLIPLAYMSNSEKQAIIKLLREIKYYHPDVHFVYYTSRYNANLFKSFVLTDEDYLIKNSNIDDIVQHLTTIPRTLRPILYQEQNVTTEFHPQIEDYVGPTEIITYKLHADSRRGIKKILITIHAFGYGSIRICTWYQFRENQRQNMHCKELAGHKEINLTDHFKCVDNIKCPSTYYRIQNVTSLFKCAEMECKTPDQVRFILRAKTIYYKSSASKKETLTIAGFLLLLFFRLSII